MKITASSWPAFNSSSNAARAPGWKVSLEKGFFSLSMLSVTPSPFVSPLTAASSAWTMPWVTASCGSSVASPTVASALSWLVNTAPKMQMKITGKAMVKNNARRFERNSVRLAR